VLRPCWCYYVSTTILRPTTSQNDFVILAFGSLGVVYGDIGTSPLYAFASVFSEQPASKQDILGAASLTFWILTIILMLKYVVIVLRADDHGEGEPAFNHPARSTPWKRSTPWTLRAKMLFCWVWALE
jgi:hypothetical protein